MPDKQRVFLEGKSRVKKWRAVAVEQMAARWAAALLLVSIDAGGERAYSIVVVGANMDMI